MDLWQQMNRSIAKQRCVAVRHRRLSAANKATQPGQIGISRAARVAEDRMALYMSQGDGNMM